MPQATQAPAAPVRPFIWAEELAEEWRIPPNTLRDCRRRGVGPRYFYIGQRVAYDRNDLDRWLKTQRERRP